MENRKRTDDCEKGLHHWLPVYKRSGKRKAFCAYCPQMAVYENSAWELFDPRGV